MATGMYREHPLPDCNLGLGSPVLSTDLLLGAIDPFTPLSNDSVYNASHLYRLHLSHINSTMLNLEHLPLRMSYLTAAETVYIKCTAKYSKDLVKAAKKLYNPKSHGVLNLIKFDYDRGLPVNSSLNEYDCLRRNLDSMGLWLVCLVSVLEREKNFQEGLHSNLNRHTSSPSLRFLTGALRSAEVTLGYFTTLFRHELGVERYSEVAKTFSLPSALPFSRIAVPWRHFAPNESFKIIDFGQPRSWNSILQNLIESHREAYNPTVRHRTVVMSQNSMGINAEANRLCTAVPATRNIEL